QRFLADERLERIAPSGTLVVEHFPVEYELRLWDRSRMRSSRGGSSRWRSCRRDLSRELRCATHHGQNRECAHPLTGCHARLSLRAVSSPAVRPAAAQAVPPAPV